jgi:FkbM family methyltransferase
MSRFPLYRESSGLWCRKGIASDTYVMSEQSGYDVLGVSTRDVVLDIGANIGVIACRALDLGAARVVAVEPHDDNVHVLQLNLGRYDPARYSILQAAVVGRGHAGGSVILHTPDDNFAMCSLVAHGAPHARLTGSVIVPAVEFEELVEQYHPTLIKIDIEAGEYGFAESLARLPAAVRGLAIEWHNFEPHLADGLFYERYLSAHETLLANGYCVTCTSGGIIRGEHSAVLHIYARSHL